VLLKHGGYCGSDVLLQPEDDRERVREAVARTFAMSLMSEDFTLDLNDWLNPTEV